MLGQARFIAAMPIPGKNRPSRTNLLNLSFTVPAKKAGNIG